MIMAHDYRNEEHRVQSIDFRFQKLELEFKVGLQPGQRCGLLSNH
jgi:hypothetical protein